MGAGARLQAHQECALFTRTRTLLPPDRARGRRSGLLVALPEDFTPEDRPKNWFVIWSICWILDRGIHQG